MCHFGNMPFPLIFQSDAKECNESMGSIVDVNSAVRIFSLARFRLTQNEVYIDIIFLLLSIFGFGCIMHQILDLVASCSLFVCFTLYIRQFKLRVLLFMNHSFSF